jgi:hypothetical protein
VEGGGGGGRGWGSAGARAGPPIRTLCLSPAPPHLTLPHSALHHEHHRALRPSAAAHPLHSQMIRHAYKLYYYRRIALPSFLINILGRSGSGIVIFGWKRID